MINRKVLFTKLIKLMAKYMSDKELKQAIYYLAQRQDNEELKESSAYALL